MKNLAIMAGVISDSGLLFWGTSYRLAQQRSLASNTQQSLLRLTTPHQRTAALLLLLSCCRLSDLPIIGHVYQTISCVSLCSTAVVLQTLVYTVLETDSKHSPRLFVHILAARSPFPFKRLLLTNVTIGLLR